MTNRRRVKVCLLALCAVASALVSSCRQTALSSPLVIKGFSFSPEMLEFILDQTDRASGALPERIKEMLRYGAVDKLILREIVREQARSKGMTVSDQEVYGVFSEGRYWLAGKTMYLPSGKDRWSGKWKSAAADKRLVEWLSKWNVSVDEFVENQRRELLASKFQQKYRNRVSIDEAKIKAEYVFNRTRVSLDAAELEPGRFHHKVKLDPELMGDERERRLKEEGLRLARQAAVGFIKRAQQGERLDLIFVDPKGDPQFGKLKRPRAPFTLRRVPLFVNDPGKPIPRLGKAPGLVKLLFKKNDDAYALKQGDLLPPTAIGGSVYVLRVRKREAPNWDSWERKKALLIRRARLLESRKLLRPKLLAHCMAARKKGQISFDRKALTRGHKPNKGERDAGGFVPCNTIKPGYALK